MSWNNIIGSPNWGGTKLFNFFPTLNVSSLNVSSLNANSINTSNITAYNGFIDYIQSIQTNATLINLNSNALFAQDGVLYLNGNVIATLSSISSIGDWSYFQAKTDVDLSFSTLKDVKNISTVGISSGTVRTNLLDSKSLSSINISTNNLFANLITNRTLNTSNSTSFNITNSNTIQTNDIIASQSVRGSNILGNNLLRVPAISSILISTSLIDANVFRGNYFMGDDLRMNSISTILISSFAITSELGIFDEVQTALLDVSQIGFLSELHANHISSSSISSATGYFSTLNAVQINSLNISNINLIETDTFYANGGLISTLVISHIGTVSTLRANNISSFNISTQRIYADLGTFSSIRVGNLSTGNISISSINSSNGVFDNLYTNNIYNTSNIRTSNLGATGLISASNVDVSGNLVVDGNTTLNNDLAMNGNINFPTNNVVSVDYPEGLAQYLKDINNLRNLNVEQITVLGGSTGNQFFPPYRNDSIINVGEDALSPGQVIINGFNPDPLDSGIALTVRGDAQIVQNANVLGLLTAEGEFNVVGAAQFEGEVNVAGLATFEDDVDVTGLATFQGAVNILGGLGVEGETNLAGGVTCEAGIGIVGALGLTGGDVSFGSASNTGNSFNVFYGTVLSNGLTVYGNTTFNGSVNLQGQQNVSSLSTFQVTTNSLKLLETGNNLSRIDFYNSANGNNYNTAQNSILQYQSNLLIDSANSIYSEALGEYHIFGNSNILINSSNEIVLSNVNATNNIILSAKDVDIPTQLRVSSISTLQLLGNQIELETKYINNDTRNAGISFLNSNSQAIGAIAEVADSNLYIVALSNMLTEVGGDYVVTSSNRAGLQSDWEFGLTSLSTILINGSEAVMITNSGSNALGIQCPTVIDNRLVVNSNIEAESVSSIYISSLQIGVDTLFGNTLNALTLSSGSISNNHLNTQSISSLRISSGSLFSGLISSQQINCSSLTANRIFTSNITGPGSAVVTTNFYPQNAGAQIGFFGSSGTNSGGFYNNISVRSTFTQVIAPDIVGIYSNIVRIQGNTLAQNLIVSSISASTIQSRSNISTNEVRTQFLRGAGPFGNFVYTTTLLPDGSVNIGNAPVNTFQQGWFNTVYASNIQANTASGLSINSTVNILGTLSTQNVTVSTINRKLYPYTSSLNSVVSTYTIDGTTANIPTVLFSNITFPHVGNYTVSAKITASKSSGGGGLDAHSFISLSRGLYASTFSEQDGFSAVPYINETNVSTFTTLNTDVYVSSMNTNTRFLTFTDYSANAYIMNLAVNRLQMRYLPIQGFSTE